MRPTLLTVLLIGAVAFGCCANKPANISTGPVYIKCKIPAVPASKLEELDESMTYPEMLKVIMDNYFKLERENELLREAERACQ